MGVKTFLGCLEPRVRASAIVQSPFICRHDAAVWRVPLAPSRRARSRIRAFASNCACSPGPTSLIVDRLSHIENMQSSLGTWNSGRWKRRVSNAVHSTSVSPAKSSGELSSLESSSTTERAGTHNASIGNATI
jgi:hypothetical protein